MNHSQWITEKPRFTEDCLLITASKIRNNWDYSSWMIEKVDSEDGWYFGWLTMGGEEYGDLADLTAQMYLTIPLLK